MNSKSAITLLLTCVFLIPRQSTCDYAEEKNDNRKFNSPYVDRNSKTIYTASKFFFPIDVYDTDKIAGGYYAVDEQFPFMAIVHQLLSDGKTAQCGGTVISKRWVLTAGHCVAYFPQNFLVVLGVIDKSGIGYNFNYGPGVSMMTSYAVVHPAYYHSTNDIGLLYMPQDIPYTQKIQPIQLAGYEAGDSFADLTAYVIGWGKDRETSGGTNALKYALLPIITNDECRQFWQIDERNICTANGLGQNACQGDSGGPLLIMKNNEPLQLGIVSFGDGNCPSEKPAVFTRITTFIPWIESITGIRY